MKIIGMISGTSYDGIDVALCDFQESNREITVQVLDFKSVPYSEELHAEIAAAMPPRTIDMERVCKLDTYIGQAFASAAKELIGQHEVSLIASHGQTLYHWIESNHALGTLQLGEPTWIAEKTGIPVLSNIRSRDVAAGGHGAPLVSLIDQMMFGDYAEPVGALNLGGISNITVTGKGMVPIAYDIGPANGLMDAALQAHSNGVIKFDKDSQISLQGEVNQKILKEMLQEPYYQAPPPKSTGKELFHLPYIKQFFGDTSTWKIADVIRTLLELTVETVAIEVERFGLKDMYVHGGGSANPLMMQRLSQRLPDCRVQPMSILGLDPRQKEAATFALIGYLSWFGLPGAIPSCTGASGNRVLGSFTPGAKPLQLPEPKPEGNYRVVIR
jgi:anhydro-N-acetylmuramic acid kinase